MKLKNTSRKTKRANAGSLPRLVGQDITKIMLEISKPGFCVVLKCLPDGFPWLNDECKPIACKKWAAEASWVKHDDGYRMREHAVADSPEEAVMLLHQAVFKLQETTLPNVAISHDSGGNR